MATADRPGSKRPWFRRRRTFAVALLVAAPVLALLLVNLWFSTPWGRDWLTTKITAHMGLKTHLQGADITPWGGIHFAGLVVEQPVSHHDPLSRPLLTVQSVRMWPLWKSLLHRRLDLQSVEIDSPRAVIPVRWLSHLAPLQSPGPPALASTDQPAPPAIPVPLPQAAPPPHPLPVIPETPEAPRLPRLDVSLAPPPALESTPGGNMTAWLTIRSGAFTLVTEGIEENLMEVEGFEASIPVAGNAAESSATVAQLRCMGADLAARIEIPIRWKAPILFCGPTESRFAGMTWRFGGKAGLVPGLPIDFESEIPLQKDCRWEFPRQGTCIVHDYRSTARFGGFLKHPSSWQGQVQAEASGVSLSIPDQPSFEFGRSGATFLMGNGIVTCPDVRMIGDNLSLLGNGTAIPDGRAAAVLRIVAEPSVAAGLTAHFQRCGVKLAFGQLGTPDRLAADIMAGANSEGMRIQLGQGGDIVGAADALEAVPRLRALTDVQPHEVTAHHNGRDP
ncbi:MAG: hypothetical protein QM755_12195 [Luteolibacter sp.]